MFKDHDHRWTTAPVSPPPAVAVEQAKRGLQGVSHE